MTLRVRLLLGLIVLTAIGLTVASAVTYHEQKMFLSRRVNEQLASAVAAPQQFTFGALGNTPPGTPRQLPFGTYAEIRRSDGTTLPLNNPMADNSKPALPPTVVVGRIFTVHHPAYRALAGVVTYGPDRFNEQQGILVVAIPLRDMNDSLHRLLKVETIVTLGVLFGLAILAWWMIKFGLRPLRSMQETAGAIAAGDLSRRVDIVDEHTEVGRLGVALNEMMQQIETAFAARA